MLVTVSWIEKKYNEFNKLYWENKLPKNLIFKINRSKNSWGFASYIYDYTNDTIIPEAITISNYYDSPENVKIQTLLHEMIHVADYVFHPERFFNNGRRISKRTYDPHGWWFNKEAKRISELSGLVITNHVTVEEVNSSSLSNKSRRLIANKQNNALICAVIGTEGIWWFKTDTNKVDYLKKTLKTQYNWKPFIGEFKTFKFYTFENERLANRRSCAIRLNGWKSNKYEFMNKMKEFKATEVYFK